VYAATDADSAEMAIKLFLDQSQFRNELDTLKTIQSLSSAVVSTVTECDVDGSAQFGMAFLPIGAPYVFRVHTFCELIQFTGDVHAAGIVHRDIRPENLLQTVDGRPFLVDWAFSCRVSLPPPSGYRGTVSFASSRILESLKGRSQPAVHTADDVESLAKIAVYYLVPDIADRVQDMIAQVHTQNLDVAAHADLSLGLWADVQTSPWAVLFKAANTSTDALCSELSKFAALST
jgi:serine/threonine protein kinase